MTQSHRLDGALEHLAAALDSLESAVARRFESEFASVDLEEELAVMQDDRGRLAIDLDAALARAHALEKAREEILRRLERASAGVGVVLGETPIGDE